jgi:hypothetical protein
MSQPHTEWRTAQCKSAEPRSQRSCILDGINPADAIPRYGHLAKHLQQVRQQSTYPNGKTIQLPKLRTGMRKLSQTRVPHNSGDGTHSHMRQLRPSSMSAYRETQKSSRSGYRTRHWANKLWDAREEGLIPENLQEAASALIEADRVS